jgi:hypothetical protein
VEKLAKIAARSSPEDISQKTTESDIQVQVEEMAPEGGFQVLILGAGRMCEPAVKYLASTGRQFGARKSSWVDGPVDERVWVVVASLFLENAQKLRKKLVFDYFIFNDCLCFLFFLCLTVIHYLTSREDHSN